ncbi:hypothetical protein CL648_00260 [bacterium]|nr:hypothetical protein [bacterium]
MAHSCKAYARLNTQICRAQYPERGKLLSTMRYKNYSNNSNYFWLALLFLLLFGGFRFVILLFGITLAILINFFPIIVIGFIGYSLLKTIRHNTGIHTNIKSTTVSHQRFTEILIRIIAHVIHSDGHVSDKELAIVIQCFHRIGFPHSRISWLMDLLQSALKQNPPLAELCTEFNASFQYQSKLILLDMVCQVAIADGSVHTNERQIIQEICQRLAIRPHDRTAFEHQYFNRSTARTNHDRYAECIAILELSGRPDIAEIKQSYKKLCKQYHPDKVQHLGQEYRTIADKKIKAITQAYQYLKSHA